MTDGSAAEPAKPAPSRDFVMAAALTLLAAGVRLVQISALGLNHFDEGGYAMGALAVAKGTAPQDLYPLQHFLSPPLYFGLSGLLMRLLGTTSDLVLFGVSIAAGVVTVPLVFLLGRLWFGRAAGIVAAILVAFSDFHVLMSRMALTDATFLALFLGALLLFTLAEQRRSLVLAAAAGLATGLAWNTKYHGWFAGVIATTALLPSLRPFDRRAFLATFARLATAGAVAALSYLPWFLWVQAQDGGYARLAAEHARFLEDWRRFPRHLAIQLDSQLYFGGPLTAVGTLLAAGAAVLLVPRQGRVQASAVGLAVAVLAAATFAGPLVPLAAGAVTAGAFAFRRQGPVPAHGLFWLFAVMTPLYHPYARLLLPFHAAAALFAGSGFVATAEALLARPAPARSRRPTLAAATIALAAAGAIALVLLRGRPALDGNPWTPSRSLRDAAEQLARVTDRSIPVAVVGEPAIVFYLRCAGRAAVHLDDPKDAPVVARPDGRMDLVTGIYARRNPAARRWLDDHHAELRDTATVPFVPNPIRVLDDAKPASARSATSGLAGAHDLRIDRLDALR